MPVRSSAKFEILLVDDDDGDVALTKMALAASPYSCNVSVVGNGQEAVYFLNRSHDRFKSAPTPDLVLLDLNLPLMTGREVLAKMKENQELAKIPVVILTTSEVERDVSACYALGAAGFVTKPLDMEDLFKAIHAVQDYWFGTVRRPSNIQRG